MAINWIFILNLLYFFLLTFLFITYLLPWCRKRHSYLYLPLGKWTHYGRSALVLITPKHAFCIISSVCEAECRHKFFCGNVSLVAELQIHSQSTNGQLAFPRLHLATVSPPPLFVWQLGFLWAGVGWFLFKWEKEMCSFHNSRQDGKRLVKRKTLSLDEYHKSNRRWFQLCSPSRDLKLFWPRTWLDVGKNGKDQD